MIWVGDQKNLSDFDKLIRFWLWSGCRPCPSVGYKIYTSAWQGYALHQVPFKFHAKWRGVMRLVYFYLSVPPSIHPQTSVYDWGTTSFQLNVIFSALIRKGTCSSTVQSTLALNLSRLCMCREEWDKKNFLLYLAGSETKLKVIPNKKFTIFRVL